VAPAKLAGRRASGSDTCRRSSNGLTYSTLGSRQNY
jgi:hypothetical protein